MSSDRQIMRMVAFIKKEAQEKVDEIDVQTDFDFETQKQNLYSERRVEIEKEFEEARKHRITQQRIARSKEINEARLAVMKERNEYMNRVRAKTLERLEKVSKSPKYGEFIRFLIAQGLMMVMEPRVTVRCRKEDEKIVRAEMQPAVRLFQDIMQKETGVTPVCELVFDEEEYLPPAPSPGFEGETSHGGVCLHANGGKIICRNTIEERLNLVFQSQSPQIRGMLFGFREGPGEIEVPSEKTALIRDD